ncbi:hypothetical protein VC83_08665 [Pseudogymnoascus destructans]|uniref:Uncharacterized protein n=1 Tax=Pseudogymnoascus destructans TaxID=655981 RepID=A0A177A092_9PEZI|nr:uncharacterized protein VC83_08665 [Pseudogymnoascus destructans]OAF54902.2 hypothetical protein VC83_08665 [Pseudogymnoascus destructans]
MAFRCPPFLSLTYFPPQFPITIPIITTDTRSNNHQNGIPHNPNHIPPPLPLPPIPPPLHRPPLTTWTSLILTHHGERRPLLTHPHSTLTPLGAHQAHSSGSLLRRRYLTGPSAYNTSFVPLHGFHKNYIDNQRVQVLSAPEQPVVASAWAFLQGLYPPVDAPAMVGGSPKAGTAGGRDWNNIWIAGSDRCALHAASTAAQINSSVYIDTTEASAPFFASMIPSVFGGVVPEMMVTYHNAPALYDYAAYATLHNSTVAETLPASALARLRALAGKRFWGVHGVQRGTGEGEEGDGEQDAILKPIAGRTFAERVLYLLTRTTTSERPGALNLLFSSSAPFVGFSSISGLAEQDARFKGVVEPGSMMVFEVFSYTDPEAGRPGKEDLWVRFLYRNGTAEGARLVGYPLFGRGRSKMDMRFSEFEKEMGAIGKGVGEWCEVCGVGPVFCPAFVEGLDKGRKEEEEKGKDGDGEGGKKKKKGTTALELGLGLGAAGFVVVFGGLVMVFCARSRRRKEVRDKEEGWEMGDRGAKEERVRSGADYEVRNEDEETVNPMREPVRVEDRV